MYDILYKTPPHQAGHKLKAYYYKGWFEVHDKISVMALTPPLSVIMTLKLVWKCPL